MLMCGLSKEQLPVNIFSSWVSITCKYILSSCVATYALINKVCRGKGFGRKEY